jgi:phosphatidylserine/phosphatidylglycerophosphate/cardiolipin synthase-like enzyme
MHILRPSPVAKAYDHRNAPKFGIGDDPAPHGTHQFLTGNFKSSDNVQLHPIEWSDVASESIEGSKSMHSKYVIVDGHTQQAAVWMGSTNFTDDAWTHQDNNILILDSPTLRASATKVAQIEALRKVLVAKKSKAFDPHHPTALHNFMHDKVVVADDVVLTGSYNFSLSAEHNAENAVLLRDGNLAEQYRGYVEQLVKKYG